MAILEVFADESCKDGHKFMSIGLVAIEQAEATLALAEFMGARHERNAWAEVKWTGMRQSRLPFYKLFVDAFFRLAAQDILHFHSLYIDTTTSDHKTYNGGHSDIGFDKLLYQLLLHKVGRKYGELYEIHVYLDKRTSKQPPEVIRPMLNDALRRDYGIDSNPFRVIRFKDSTESDFIQIVDLFCGALASRKNGYHQLPGASVYKRELGDHIARSAGQLEAPYSLEGVNARRFTIWPFKYRGS